MNALDDVLPAYSHHERHTIEIAAAPDAVWDALHAVSNGDLPLTRVLMGIRALPMGLPGGRAPTERGFVEASIDRGFRKLRVDPPETLVVGAVGQPWRLQGGEKFDFVDLEGFRTFVRPGFVRMATSFEIDALGDRLRLSTETRVQPTDAAAAGAFRRYWWAIRCGSGLIRREVLRAVRRAAEHK